MSIPRITHQIWMQGWDELPAKFHGNVRALRELNPNYTHMTWDEKSLRLECRKYGGNCLAKFDSFKRMISKVDLGRYIILYHYGGFSIDTDMKPLQPLDKTPVFDGKGDMYISASAYPFQHMVNNGILICRPYHPFLKDIIDTILADTTREEDYALQEMYVHNTTGPLFVGKRLDKYKNQVEILDNQYFEPCLSTDPYCKAGKESIMDHQHEMSWFSKAGKAVLDFASLILFTVLYYFSYILVAIIIVYGLYHLQKGTIKKLNFSALGKGT